MSGEWGTQSRPSRGALRTGPCWRGREAEGRGQVELPQVGATSPSSHCSTTATPGAPATALENTDRTCKSSEPLAVCALGPLADAGKGVASLSLLPPSYLPGPPRIPWMGRGPEPAGPCTGRRPEGNRQKERSLPFGPGCTVLPGAHPSCSPAKHSLLAVQRNLTSFASGPLGLKSGVPLKSTP